MPRSTTFIMLNLAHFFDHYILLIFPTAALAIEGEWQMGYGEVLALGTWTFAAFALATLPSGWLGDRWSRQAMMKLFFMGGGLSCLAAGLAPDRATLAAALAGIGVFAAIYHPVGTAMVVQHTGRAGRSLSINGVFGNLGIAATALVTAALSARFGWQTAFLAPGIVMLAIGLFWLLLPGGAGATAVSDSAPENQPIDTRGQMRVFAFVGCSALFGGLVFNATTIVLPKLLEERLGGSGIGLAGIGGLAAIVFATAAVAQLPVGYLLDRHGARRILLVVLGLQAPLLWLLAVANGPAAVAAAMALMLLVFGEIPITAWLLGRYVVPAWRSRAYAVEYLIALGIGAATVPLVAVLHDWTGGFAMLFRLLGAGVALAATAAWFLPRQRPTTAEALAA